MKEREKFISSFVKQVTELKWRDGGFSTFTWKWELDEVSGFKTLTLTFIPKLPY